ncbi:MAG: hypothetical protein H7A41_07590 [Chlamydiales bacterium]|nr:hypothetical protein [Chlamydiia bacterium]MCP5504997.1 hypothetical protein [Chlamydiales bacterium]
MLMRQSSPYAVDTIWKKLQQKDRWFGPKDPFCHQSGNYSDIEHIPKQVPIRLISLFFDFS